jgi:hypothetical protein
MQLPKEGRLKKEEIEKWSITKGAHLYLTHQNFFFEKSRILFATAQIT